MTQFARKIAIISVVANGMIMGSRGLFVMILYHLSGNVKYILGNSKKHVGTLANCSIQNGGRFPKTF